MRLLRNNFSFILALIAILFSIQFSILAKNTVKDYEKLMNNDYNIVIVSTKELSEAVIKPLINTFSSISQISSDKILNRLQNDISNKNLSILKNTLPKFYSLKLNSLPSTKYMNEIRQKLLKVDGINKIETFAKTHNKVYKTLKLTKSIAYIFMFLVAFIGLLLMSKQIRIWVYEHKERIEIMSLFGAGFWLKSSVLYKSAIFCAIFSTLIISLIFYFLPNINFIKEEVEQISINISKISLYDSLTLLVSALVFSFFAVSVVMKKAK
ncbi:cell division protein FtsX [Campylobacter pinnipediorum]|uniref:Cell division protein FtsX n=1 Tax=Campylobacter pinnipediorum subsp. pinnipediorum TaxID=1660067 RepID=A0AAX0L986_9BACT|nr:cell division protein FtsX [Campylobacter pinnipediorum]AQW81788.1 cell division protein FtsX [Campylobacter pinnipediorum subsp. pinnipediorum]AQW83464.1 cell division protein FtsX [Campylobacter pinnipediorum subsp. pinnipediorum]AQW84985.1 cell division protein FtsX [Campylobacter pinnipediorum subsp. pinnipediorum]OPA76374.1 cell division protein FtsX [Campylobacter pinnipediorum subsp. pinnipediorum]OPA79836.1 cell division protein FtsX [Campylobacter pinnipediorum subsp. pinnipediorum